MSIAIALVPSLLFGALSLLLGAFPTDIRRQNTAVMVGAGAVSLGCAAMLGSSWSLSATVWGVVCGLMWTGGQVFVLWAFRAWGVSRTMPLTTALQLLLNATLGVSLFGEWRAPGALILGVVALALIMLGAALAYGALAGILTVVTLGAAAIVLVPLAILFWPICMVWGAVAASNHNARLQRQSAALYGAPFPR